MAEGLCLEIDGPNFFVLYLGKEVLVGWFRRAVNIFGCGSKLFSLACPLPPPPKKSCVGVTTVM